ncbi:WD40-repeat-containing domain protein [Gymnopilus junonius]|uniref:WD repeat-containing protein JIP5 n=1 Tax=Gymnopilus junonius TaxID=109634 RepID=A0A9P5NFX8_GYMJU|nr:WD40-repeat-containing domain protein [Gymnopilus junonius]
MPEIPVGAQIFDVVFHPTFSTVYVGLLTGHVKAYAYDEQGGHKPAFSVRTFQVILSGFLYAVGKGKALYTIDTLTEAIDTRPGAHDSTINRVKHLMPRLLSTGDDDGTVKLWDHRQRDSIRTYTQHFDYITDFLWLDDKRQLVATSGDGTLSVMDVRSKKTEPIAQSEDQEDELLSIVSIKGGNKSVVGTQLGILSIFNRSSGWGDCVDRVPGHPLSVDALCALPAELPNVDTASTILTGSSDGYVRAVEILPTKLLGVVADHGEWPLSGLQLVAVGSSDKDNFVGARCGSTHADHDEERTSPGRWWVGSVGHEDMLRMTDLEGFFRENKENEVSTSLSVTDADEIDSGGEEEEQVELEPKKRKRRHENEAVIPTKKKKGKNGVVVERSFFDDL